MALTLTFFGKGGTGRTTAAIATAKQLASQGKRVLLASQDPSPAFPLLLGAEVGPDPQAIVPNLEVVQFQTTVLVERGWQEIKQLEKQYLRTPVLKEIFGQELGILPGVDGVLGMNALREYEEAGRYDVMVYDGSGDLPLLRILGTPEILSWYVRRLRQVWSGSDLGKALSPFLQPIAAATMTVNLFDDNFAEPTQQTNNRLDQGKAAIANPNRFAGYLVATEDSASLATAKYLWGSAQQIGLRMGGLILNQATSTEAISQDFSPLPIASLPTKAADDWQPLMDALPDFSQVAQMPAPIEIDEANSQIRLFLPGFDKKQVKLTQYGPEITVEAGDQRRNIYLPGRLSGRSVTGAKFQFPYLILSL